MAKNIIATARTPTNVSVFELSKKIDSLLEVIKDVVKRTNILFNLDETIDNAGKVLQISENGIELMWNDVIVYSETHPEHRANKGSLYFHMKHKQNTFAYRWNHHREEYESLGAFVNYDHVNENISIGNNALHAKNGGFNIAIGEKSLKKNNGQNNTALGHQSLENNVEGCDNLAVGSLALNNNIQGAQNTSIGNQSLEFNTSGSSNVAIGTLSLNTMTSGSSNIGIGENAGNNLKTGNKNIYIGSDNSFAVAQSPDESNTIRIGNAITNKTFISGIHNMPTHISESLPIMIDSSGQLGTVPSSIKYKENVTDMNLASECIYDLRPVTYHYKQDSKQKIQYGLIAEEVHQVNPALVVGKNDEIDAVQYYKLIPMLLNEIQKLRKRVDELSIFNQNL